MMIAKSIVSFTQSHAVVFVLPELTRVLWTGKDTVLQFQKSKIVYIQKMEYAECHA